MTATEALKHIRVLIEAAREADEDTVRRLLEEMDRIALKALREGRPSLTVVPPSPREPNT